MKLCDACGTAGAKLRCGRCHEAVYCDRACQKMAWRKGHKSKCAPKAAKPSAAGAVAAPPPPPPTAGSAATATDGGGGEECAICLDALQQPQTLPCNHRFCRGCVASMRQHGVGAAQVCPLCRGPMPDDVDRLMAEAAQLLTQCDRLKGSSGGDGVVGVLPGVAGALLPPATQGLLRRGSMLDKAAALLREAVATDPKNAQAHATLGFTLASAGDGDGAIAAYRAAIALEPSRGVAHQGLGDVLHGRGDMAGARHAFHCATIADPQDASAHHSLGVVLHTLGDLAGAETAYRAAIAADPRAAFRAYGGLGMILDGRGDAAGAEAALRAAVATSSPSPVELSRAHFNLAVHYNRGGDRAGAAASFAKVLEVDPSNADAKRYVDHYLALAAQAALDA
jgi:Flp pilus assembly protein TadD